ncbi:MAG: hypothetical protein AB1898_15315 [Acidobacteriota bacterium]
MAKGWESKAVEEQMSLAESRRESSRKASSRHRTIEPKKREQLLLARTRVVKDIENTSNERYRAYLRESLAAIDQELARLAGGT